MHAGSEGSWGGKMTLGGTKGHSHLRRKWVGWVLTKNFGLGNDESMNLSTLLSSMIAWLIIIVYIYRNWRKF
jgi:hypothetical protein